MRQLKGNVESRLTDVLKFSKFSKFKSFNFNTIKIYIKT